MRQDICIILYVFDFGYQFGRRFVRTIEKWARECDGVVVGVERSSGWGSMWSKVRKGEDIRCGPIPMFDVFIEKEEKVGLTGRITLLYQL